jgi:hypothetical protein
MFQDKPWYLSKTVILGVIVAAMGVYGIDVDQDMYKTITENVGKISELIAVGLMIYGRVMATTTLTATQKTEHIAEFVPPSIPVPVAPVVMQPLVVAPPVVDDARG